MERNRAIAKAVSYVFLILCVAAFFQQFKRSVRPSDSAPTPYSLKQPSEQVDADSATVRTLKFLVLFLAAGVSLAFLFAWDFCHVVADRAVDALFGLNGQPEQTAVILKAELLRKQGFPFEAIELLRDHFHAHRRDTHAGVLIAEIYEHDLRNPLAAALEHEEMLTWRMKKERWAKLAVRAAALHARDLNRNDRASEIRRLFVAMCPDTRAARSAATRLAYVDAISSRGDVSAFQKGGGNVK